LPDEVRVRFRKTSLVDWPGRLAAALFFPGCNLRCPWCQNRELVLAPGENAGAAAHSNLPALEEALAHIGKRRNILGGVVLSGGEPLIHAALPGVIAEIHRLGLPVKLDTNGMRPDLLAALFSGEGTRPDCLALDLKLAPDRYGELLPPRRVSATAEAAGDPGAALRESARLASEPGMEHEYRSLALPGTFFGEGDIAALAPLVDGASPWHFRRFIPGSCLNPAWDGFETPSDIAERLAACARSFGKNAIAPSP
jgi:pyruvate formate lyase activating enzyme